MIRKTKKQCIVLLSGGLDSATVLNIALKEYQVTALVFDYGQRHKFEISAAEKIADKYAVILDTYTLLLDDDILVNENGVEGRSQEKKYYRKRKVPRKKNKNYETKPKIGDDEKAQKISEQERYFQWEVYHSDIV